MDKSQNASELHRALGFVDLLLFVVITCFGIIGATKAAEAGPVSITYWALTGLTFYVPLAFCVIILGARYPGEGGLYVWSQQNFGDFAGFMTGWAYWICNIAFLPLVLYFIAGSALFVGPAGWGWQELATNPVYFIGASLVCLGVATASNIVDLNVGKWLNNAGAVGTWLPALGLIIFAFISWAEHGPATEMSEGQFVPRLSIKEAILWPLLILTLTGLEAAAILGSEIKDPRLLPTALILGAVLVIVTQILVTLAALAALAPHELNGSVDFMQAFGNTASRAGVGGLLPFTAIVVVVGSLGKVSAWSAAGARLPMVAGGLRNIPAMFGRLHPRWGTPYVAVLFQSAAVAVLVVIGQAGTSTKGAYDVFQSMTFIPTFIPFLFVFAAAIKVQWAKPGPGRMRTPLGRWTAVGTGFVGLVTTAIATVLAVIPPDDEPNQVLYVIKIVGLALVMIGTGVLIYFPATNSKANSHSQEGSRY